MKQYPKQIFNLATKTTSMDCVAEMVAVTEEDSNQPLEMHAGGLSRFILTMKGEGGFATANIPAWDVAGMIEQSHVALQADAVSKMQKNAPKEDSCPINMAVFAELKARAENGDVLDAYDLSLLETKDDDKTNDADPEIYSFALPICRGKTAAEFVSASSKEEVENKISFINTTESSKFREQNMKQKRLLEEALALQAAGKLNSAAVATTASPNEETDGGIFLIYKKGPKPRVSKKSPDGKACQCYNVEVTYKAGDRYPFNVKIDNWYAPVSKTASGTLNVGAKTSDPQVTKHMRLSVEDWMGAIRRMERTMNMFEDMHFEEMMNMAAKYAWKPKKDTD